MSADIASYYSEDSDSLDPDPIRIPTMCESSAHEKKKGCDSSLGITLEKKKRKNKGQLHVVDRIQILKKVLGKRRGVGCLSKSQSTTRHTKYTQTQVPTHTQQSLEKIQRLERLITELQNQVQHISKKLPVEHCLPPVNKKEELIRKHGNMHSTRPSQHHMSHMFGNGSVSSSQPLTSHSNIHGPSTSQYQGQMSMLPPSQQPSSTPYYPNMYNSASQQLPPTPYQYPYMYGAPSQQPLPLYHYPNTYGFPLQQPMPPHHNPNTYGLPLQQPTPPYHNPNTYGLPLQQPTPPYHNPNTYGLPLQQPTPPYHNANTYGPPLQQPMPSDRNPNTYAPPSQQPMPSDHNPNTYATPSQQPMPSDHNPNTYAPSSQQPMPSDHNPNTHGLPLQQAPWPKVSDNAKDACPKSGHTTQKVVDHPELQNAKKAPKLYSLENLRARLKHFSTMNNFKKIALRAMAHELLSVEEIRDMQKRFDFMDTTRRGRINLDELRIGLHKLGNHFPEAGVDMIMEADRQNFVQEVITVKSLIGISQEYPPNLIFKTPRSTPKLWPARIVELVFAKELNPTNLTELVVKLVRTGDQNYKDGYMEYGEFAIISFYLKKMHSKDEFIDKAFEYFDYFECGSIGISELRIGLTHEVEEKNIEEVIEAIMQEVDTDKYQVHNPSFQNHKVR
ncbi:hypothetical protein F8388_022496 [Cannabis sativa]|uniref:EF-hand domain-containing protein n=1 Tax=Cannabis sativa TaxID=3483 RepID=A0A7J6EYV1_CANSA|nr:hypothetical protein F8388_022496 [Cannabis sativa]